MADKEKDIQVKLTFKDELSAQMSAVGSKIEGALKKVSVASAAAITGIAAFAVKTVKDMGSTAEEIDNMSKRTGLAAHQVSALRLAADQTSIPLATMETAMKKLAVNMTNMNDGGVKSQAVFKDLKLKFSDITKLSPDKQFFEIGNAIAKIEDPTKRTAVAMQVFGKAGTELIPMFGKGAMSMQDWIDKSEELGVNMDQVMVDRALAADQAFDDFDSSMKGLVQTIAVQFLPVVVDIMNKITPVLISIGKWIGDNKELVTQIALVAGGVLAFGAVLGPVITAVRTLGVLIAVLTSPIGLVVAAIAALVAGIVYLYNTNETFRNKVNAAWEAVKTGVTTVIDRYLKPAFEWVTKTLPESMAKAWDEMSTAVNNSWNAIKTFLIDNIITPIRNAFQAFNDFMRPLWDALWKFYQAVIQPILEFVGKLISDAFESIKQKFMVYAEAIKKIWEVFWNAIKVIGPPVWDAIKAGAEGLGKALEVVFNVIKSVLTTIWSGVWDTIKGIVTSARDIIVSIINGITDAITAIPRAVGNAVEYVKNIPSKVGTSISNTSKSISDSIYAARKTYLGYAEGGNPPVGVPSIVGENGPEMIVPKSAMTVIPNHKLGGQTIVVNITGNNLWDRTAAEKLLEMATRKLFITNKVA